MKPTKAWTTTGVGAVVQTTRRAVGTLAGVGTSAGGRGEAAPRPAVRTDAEAVGTTENLRRGVGAGVGSACEDGADGRLEGFLAVDRAGDVADVGARGGGGAEAADKGRVVRCPGAMALALEGRPATVSIENLEDEGP